MVPICEKYHQERRQQVAKARLAHLRNALDSRLSNGEPRTAESDREPGFFDLATMPEFQALLRDESDDTEDETIDRRLDGLIETWTNYYRNVFAELALVGLGEFSAALDLFNLLDLAIVHFACTRCQRRQLRWPQVLSHRCFRDRSITQALCVGGDRSFIDFLRSSHDMPYRGQEVARFDDHLEVAREIIALAGLSPESATYQDMEASGARFVCRGCPISTMRTAYDWQAAVRRTCATPWMHVPLLLTLANCGPLRSTHRSTIPRLFTRQTARMPAPSGNPCRSIMRSRSSTSRGYSMRRTTCSPSSRRTY